MTGTQSGTRLSDPTELRGLLQPAASSLPVPLVHWPKRFALIWSAKAGCTQALLWFLAQCDLLRAAAYYSYWPHNFREQVLYRSETYQSWLADCDPAELRWVRVIRDPFKRAVSSYRHILLTTYEDSQIGAHLGRPVTSASGYSFREFLSYIKTKNLASCDVHYCQQYSSIEKYVSPIVINIDRVDIVCALYELGNIFNLPRLSRYEVRFLRDEAMRVAKLHNAPRNGRGAVDASNQRFSAEMGLDAWPDYLEFATDETREAVSSLYATDHRVYKSDLTEISKIFSGRVWPRWRR
jgi:hypothetical protein